jgi:hypothetical protein
MVQLHTIEEQLKDIGSNYHFFGRPEIRELAKIITPGEVISRAVNGFYEGGFALLVVTDRRLLLVDKKPMYLTIEDLRFDMIAEIDFNHRLLNATVRVFSTNKSLMFTSWNHAKLRALVEHLQHRVMLIRQHHIPAVQAQFPTFSAPQQIPAAVTNQQYGTPQPIYTPAQAQQREVPHLLPSIAQLAMQGTTPDNVGALPATTTGAQYVTSRFSNRRRKFPTFY